MIYLTTILIFVIFTQVTIAESTCEGKDGFKCCDGYNWNTENKTCINNTFKQSGSATRTTTSQGVTLQNHVTVSPSTAKSNEAEATPSHDLSSLEEKLKIIINRLSTKPKHQTGGTFQVPLQIGMASILLILFVFIVIYLVKKGKKCAISLTSRPSEILPRNSYRYHCFQTGEHFSPSIISDGVFFDEISELRMNYYDERKPYTLDRPTQSVEGEECRAHKITNHKHLNTDQWNGVVYTPVTTSTCHLPSPYCPPDQLRSGEQDK